MKIGAQGYTIREFAKTPEMIRTSFQKLHEIGFSVVQVSAFGDISAKELSQIATDNEIEILLTHTAPNRILNETEQVIAEHQEFGCTNIGIGYMPEEYHGKVQNFIADFSEAAKKIKAAGMTLQYHNHSFEFQKYDGKTMFEELLQSKLFHMVVDCYWVQHAGADSAKLIRDYADQIDFVHLKDMAICDGEQRMAPVYEGNMNYDEILKACEEAGVQCGFIEQDECYELNPFDALKLSFDNLMKRGI